MASLKDKLRVSTDKLQYHFDLEKLPDISFDSIKPCCEIIGQERAISSVEQGLAIKSKGYNIFVTGHPGTGRTTAMKLLLEAFREKEEPELVDICFVHNFKMAECPRVLYLPAGEGRKFKKAVSYLIDSLTSVIPKIFSSENYQERRDRIAGEFESRQKELFKEFEKKIKDKGFILVQLQMGPVTRPDLQPVIDGQAMSFPELEKAVEEKKFPAEKLEQLQQEYENLQKDLQATSLQSKKISTDLEEELKRLNTSLAVPLINDKIDTLKNVYAGEKVRSYLDELNEILIDLLDVFQSGGNDAASKSDAAKMREIFQQFTVNLLVDNAEQKKRPIIIEDFPTHKKLFGSIERVYDSSSGWHSNFTRIRGGSFLDANGGYLVLHVLDLFQDPMVWPTLKRILRTGHLNIANIEPINLTGGSLRPEAIDLDVKVILVGESRIYDLLYHADDDFKKVFKIKAEFDNVIKNDSSGVGQYAEFIKKVVTDEKILPFDRSGLAAMAAYGVKLAGYKDRLSTRFTQIADLAREAAWLAKKENFSEVNKDTVHRTIRLQKERVNLMETKIQEMYERDLFLIDVKGSKIGQINGLSVYDLGDYVFGRPTRITASLSPGADGVINIEREAAMSGRIHDKGVYILSGFMRNRFGQKRPLVFTASLCFEQSYGGIDGDSASSTEIYALLSVLSSIPINQALAVTGSVNQKGEIQPIGGVNEKIEGYFDVCLIDGLTGDQGVIIPRQNEPELMLKDEIVKAVGDGKFHIYAVSHIDEGIELLTGIPAGESDADGNFPEGSICYLASNRLDELASTWREYINRH